MINRLDLCGDFARVAAGPVGATDDDNHGHVLCRAAGFVQHFAKRSTGVFGLPGGQRRQSGAFNCPLPCLQWIGLRIRLALCMWYSRCWKQIFCGLRRITTTTITGQSKSCRGKPESEPNARSKQASSNRVKRVLPLEALNAFDRATNELAPGPYS